MLRQPIITVLGHVDHGKTTLLDAIRQTAIASKEAGGITQAIGTTEIPTSAVENMCSHLLEKFNFKITVPGLLFIDTPGHEAFTTLRKRGGSIADLAILVVDINEGVMPQTAESIGILKSSKTPFIIAVNKIDRIHGWISADKCFMHNYPEQADAVKEEFEKMFYRVVESMSEHGFSVERFDRVIDFQKTIAAVPVSAKTGEGISDMLVTLAGLAQQFLGKQLEMTDKSCGIILEVKEVTGLGAVIDCVIYDGVVRKSDFLVLASPAMIARIRALLVPEAMHDMRTEKKFCSVEDVHAAAGVRIAAPGLASTVAGSEIRTAKSMEEAELLLDELEAQKREVEIFTEKQGLVLKADTLGSLEALINIFGKHPIKQAAIGRISRRDVVGAAANKDATRAVIGFNAPASEEAAAFAADNDVKLFESDVIYSLIEGYEKWVAEMESAVREQELASLARPGKIRILPGCIFRQSDPAIVGCEVIAGIIRPGCRLFKYLKQIFPAGEIKQIQSQGKGVPEARQGDRVAISISDATVGRQIAENDVLYTDISSADFQKLRKNEAMLSRGELDVLEEIVQINRRHDPGWGIM